MNDEFEEITSDLRPGYEVPTVEIAEDFLESEKIWTEKLTAAQEELSSQMPGTTAHRDALYQVHVAEVGLHNTKALFDGTDLRELELREDFDKRYEEGS